MAKRTGRGSPNYGQHRRVRPDGYVDLWLPGHPMAQKDGYAAEHRVVLHDAGVVIGPGMHVHHRNHDRADNRIENLEVLTAAEHGRHHAEEGGTVTNQHGTFEVGTGFDRRHAELKAALGDRRCPRCNADMNDLRLDAKFCSVSCQQAAWRTTERVVSECPGYKRHWYSAGGVKVPNCTRCGAPDPRWGEA